MFGPKSMNVRSWRAKQSLCVRYSSAQRRRGMPKFKTTPMQNSQARHFCAAELSCGFASTQSAGPFPAKCRFFQNGASVFR